MNDGGRFWIVLGGEPTPAAGWQEVVKVRHAARADADAEAERMARQHGRRFYVLVAVGAVAQEPPPEPPLVWEPFAE